MRKHAFNRIHIIWAPLFLLACGINMEKEAMHPSSDSLGETKEYEAVLTCGFDPINQVRSEIAIQSCFSGGATNSDTKFQIKNAGKFRMYDAVSLNELGKRGSDGRSLHIALSKHYAIRAQNASSDFDLNLKIIDSSGTVTFQKTVGRYGLIETEN
ncbi:hypothetical protein ACO0KY_14355 [Undibacterium sp. Dicai25W]|uniref:hypothetical protein n=1 Tax=Undibacterium sp. Dicai25W TaxID=3413034 RepID=UPI003BF1757E